MNGETKPRIHLVKKVAKTSAISMAVEDEVEVMDDSEDELIVNRSTENRDYSHSSKAHLYKLNSEDLEDDTEEELSLLYEDDDTEDVKPTANELKGKEEIVYFIIIFCEITWLCSSIFFFKKIKGQKKW